jgi:hypothetical protein
MMNNPYQNNPGMNPMANMTPAQLEMMKKYAMMNGRAGGMGSNPNMGGMSMVDKLFKDSPVAGPGGGTSLADLNKMPTNNSVQHKRNQKSPESDNNREEQNKIHHLVKNINQSLDDYAPSKSQNTEDSDDDSTEKEEYTNSKIKSSDSYVPEILKEPLLLIIIYVVMSQGFVRKGIGSYISYINPSQDGYVSLIGYVIYGTILALLFMFFKKITIK